jgi:hypothetical protein
VTQLENQDQVESTPTPISAEVTISNDADTAAKFFQCTDIFHKGKTADQSTRSCMPQRVLQVRSWHVPNQLCNRPNASCRPDCTRRKEPRHTPFVWTEKLSAVCNMLRRAFFPLSCFRPILMWNRKVMTIYRRSCQVTWLFKTSARSASIRSTSSRRSLAVPAHGSAPSLSPEISGDSPIHLSFAQP